VIVAPVDGRANSAAKTFTYVAAGGVPSDAFFVSDWASNDVTDSAKSRPWGLLSDAGGAFAVRDTSDDGRDYPTEKYLRMTDTSGTTILAFEDNESYVSAPGVGDSIYLRLYKRVTHSGTGPDSHGDYFNDNQGTSNWGPQAFGFYIKAIQATTYQLRLSAAAGIDAPNDRYFEPPVLLDKDVTYRFEIKYTRTGTDTYTLEARIYDVNDNLLYDTPDFEASWNAGLFLDEKTFTISGAGAASMVGFQIGIEETIAGAYAEWAGVLLRTDDWGGAYNVAEASS